MRIGTVGDAGLAEVADVVEIFLDLLVAPRQVQRYLRHIMQAAARARAAPDVVDPEAAGLPLLPHLSEGFSRRILSIRREAYPSHAELLQIQHVFRRRRTRARSDLDAWRDRRQLCGAARRRGHQSSSADGKFREFPASGMEGRIRIFRVVCTHMQAPLKLRAERQLNVGLRTAEVGKIADRARKPAPRRARYPAGTYVVGRVGRRKLRPFPRQVMAVQAGTQLQALALGLPGLGDEELHPENGGRVEYPRSQRSDRVGVRIRKFVDVEVRSLRGGWKTVPHVPVRNDRLAERTHGINPVSGDQVLVGAAAGGDGYRYSRESVLAQIHLPSAEYGVQQPASIEETLPFADRQFVNYVCAEVSLLVISCARFPGADIVSQRIVVAQRLRPVEGGIQSHPAAVAFLHGEVSAMPSAVIEVRKIIDGSELRIKEIILRRLVDRIEQCPVVAKDDRIGNLVDVPTALQFHASGPLIDCA